MTFFYLDGFVIEKERVNTHVCAPANALILSLRLNENFDEVNVNICRKNTFEAEWFMTGKQPLIFISNDEKVFICKAACFFSLEAVKQFHLFSPVVSNLTCRRFRRNAVFLCSYLSRIDWEGKWDLPRLNPIDLYFDDVIVYLKKLRARAHFFPFFLALSLSLPLL